MAEACPVFSLFLRTVSMKKHQRGLSSLHFLKHSTRQQGRGAGALNMHHLADHKVALSHPLIKRQLLPNTVEKACLKTLDFPCLMDD